MEMKTVKLTYNDYLSLPDDSKRYELYDGELYMVPSPRVKHQRIYRKLILILDQYVEKNKLGEILSAPLDVVFDEENFLQPDIIFISNERSDIIGEKNITGAPDLVIEILSPSTEYRDRGHKLQTYCRYGVREYWLVDPEKEIVEIMSLSPEGYQLLGKYSGDDLVGSQGLAGLQFSAKQIFA